MKKVIVALMFVALLMVAGNASAAITLTLDPTGAVTAAGGAAETVNIYANTGGDAYAMYAVQFGLMPNADIDQAGATSASSPIAGTFTTSAWSVDGFYAVSVAAGGASFALNGSHVLLATVNLTLAGTIAAGNGPDLFIRNSADDPLMQEGFTLATFDTMAFTSDGLGPDYGPEAPPAVPVPGALYLLGSGLVGLIGLRRRTR